jgi:hypothetical protein
MAYTKATVDKLIKDLRGAGDDDEAFNAAECALAENAGLEDFMRKQLGIKDPVGYIATRI